MIIGVTRETSAGEQRVALIPQAAAALKKLGAELLVEAGAGVAAGYPDDQYQSAGAELAPNRDAVVERSEILVQVRAANAHSDAAAGEWRSLRPGQVLIAQCDPLTDPQAIVELAQRRAAVFSLELVPRTTRAQSMDVLSSMATIAGYKAVLLAANALPQMFPLMMTAAGTLKPARVLILGAGVAGLQAIATARRLGAVVSANDVRPVVKEQVESLGAKFIELPLPGAEGQGGYARELDEESLRKQREVMLKAIAESDVVITTAAVPGRKAPILVTEDMVRAMPPGAVLVDIAAERGGNCSLTKPGEAVRTGGVMILGPVNLASDVPHHASQMFSNNVINFLKLLVKEGRLTLNLSDDILAGSLTTHDGQVVHPLVRKLAGLPEQIEAPPPVAASETPPAIPPSGDGDTYRIQS